MAGVDADGPAGRPLGPGALGRPLGPGTVDRPLGTGAAGGPLGPLAAGGPLGPGAAGGGPLGPGAEGGGPLGPGAAGGPLGSDEEPDGISGRSVTTEAAKSLSVKTCRFMGHIPVHRKDSIKLCCVVARGSSLPAMPGIS